LVAILDADKEGFLRNERSLVQTVGRAARNVNGTVIMYADKVTDSMEKTIRETLRRRKIQIAYNEATGIKPTALNKTIGKTLENVKIIHEDKMYRQLTQEELNLENDPIIQNMNQEQLINNIQFIRKSMEKAAKELDFMEAARLRDELYALEKLQKNK
jgi:excinuclease ABC subunit B